MGKLVKAISEDGTVICYAIDSTDMISRAEQMHRTSATVTAALGRLLTAASIMGSMLKDSNHSITLRMAGDGPVGAVIAVSDAGGNIRGYAVNPIIEIPLNKYGKLDVAGAIGKNGLLAVMRDVGMDMPQTGYSEIVSGEVAEDITYYYANSEQIPTVCGLGVLVNTDLTVLAAGGYILQLLPGADEDTISRIEKNVELIPPVSSLIHQGWSPNQVIDEVLKGFQPQVLQELITEYRCNCSRDRVERALTTLGKEELISLAGEQTATVVDCHFCNKKYRFSAKEIVALAQ